MALASSVGESFLWWVRCVDDVFVAWRGTGAPGSFGIAVAHPSVLSDFMVVVE